MNPKVLRVLLTGAAGRIGYALIPLIGQGLAFGQDQLVDLILLDIPVMKTYLEGLEMEINDCNFSLIKKITISVDPEEAFVDADLVIFLGAAPRKEGMTRAELLMKNKQIFEEQGKFLEKYSKSAPSIPKSNITSLMRLDQNRAVSMFASKVNLPRESIKNLVVWGNHSDTQFPCLDFVKIEGDDTFLITQEVKSWASSTMISTVSKRGGEVIKKLSVSSALSAAKAICDHLKDWYLGTSEGTFVTMGVHSDGSYNIPAGLVCGLPVTCLGSFKYEIKKGLEVSTEARQFIDKSVAELIEERDAALV